MDCKGQDSQSTASNISVSKRICLMPAEAYGALATTGATKAGNSFIKELILGLLAGAFIGLGFTTCMLAAGQLSAQTRTDEPGLFNLLFGIYGFPTGLSLVVLSGSSLFTGNVAYMMSSWMERKTTLAQGAWICVLSWLANLAGSLVLAQLMISGHVFTGREAFTTALAVKKVSLSFGATLVKGMLCNWLVCMAIYQAQAAQDISGKILGIFLPVSAFVTGGFEHCVANMFVMPLAIMLGAPITPKDFIVKNLIPVTLGNTISGCVFVAMSFGFSYGTPEKVFTATVQKYWAKLTDRESMLPVAAGDKNGVIYFDDSCRPATRASIDYC